MAKPRSLRPWWWNEFRDDGMRAGMPFTFMQVEHLTALGIVREADDIPMLDGDLLANWAPPAHATAGYVLQSTSSIVRPSLTGTRIDELAAQALWSRRAELESGGLLTRHAWCTHWGRHFEDQRTGHYTQIARWCPEHRNVRARHLPQRRQCVALDCDSWFRPSKGDRIYCSNACRSAAGTATTAAPSGS
jgi:hypothetical protein